MTLRAHSGGGRGSPTTERGLEVTPAGVLDSSVLGVAVETPDQRADRPAQVTARSRAVRSYAEYSPDALSAEV
jgi:hypothetical protein